jgi:hypothetical protein
MRAQFRIGQGCPSSRIWAASFLADSELLPGPHVEQMPSILSLQTSQLIPQAPVGTVYPNLFSRDLNAA